MANKRPKITPWTIAYELQDEALGRITEKGLKVAEYWVAVLEVASERIYRLEIGKEWKM